MSGLTLEDIRALADQRLSGLDPGLDLDPLQSALITYALAVAPACLDVEAADAAAAIALQHGATVGMLHEVIVLVSGMGVHALMAMSGRLPSPEISDDARVSLWTKYVGDNPYWKTFDVKVPGFLRALLAHSPVAFAGFFEYCAVPWKERSLPSRTMELISLAVDACPAHRFGPGFRLHLDNALELGVSPRQISSALDIAAASGHHKGVV